MAEPHKEVKETRNFFANLRSVNCKLEPMNIFSRTLNFKNKGKSKFSIRRKKH